jgi:hypothetical protein
MSYLEDPSIDTIELNLVRHLAMFGATIIFINITVLFLTALLFMITGFPDEPPDVVEEQIVLAWNARV